MSPARCRISGVGRFATFQGSANTLSIITADLQKPSGSTNSAANVQNNGKANFVSAWVEALAGQDFLRFLGAMSGLRDGFSVASFTAPPTDATRPFNRSASSFRLRTRPGNFLPLTLQLVQPLNDCSKSAASKTCSKDLRHLKAPRLPACISADHPFHRLRIER